MKRYFLTVCSFISVYISAQDITISKDIKKAMDRIDTNMIRSHIVYLADDKLKGRLPGTEGYQMAVDYVIDQYKKIGLSPGGDNGGFRQKLVIRKSIVENSSAIAVLKDKTGNTDSLTFARDFAPAPHPIHKSTSAEGQLVFAGYGVEIPGGYSDYSGIDVKGKIVIVVAGAPDGLPSTVTAHFSNGGNKMTVAFEKGAIGVIMYNPQSRPSTGINPTLQSNTTVNPEKTSAYSRGFVGNLNVVINAATPLMRRLFLNSG
ncbi:MAG TPA: PA domain-containing protein, partial [Chitinophagaceae bacterium]|nr:PA domain-containing protein [Chitinophagaceae bacterium]